MVKVEAPVLLDNGLIVKETDPWGKQRSQPDAVKDEQDPGP